MNTWTARRSLMKQDWRYSANIHEGGISEVDYDHSLSVWRTFQMSILGAYLDLYMQTDIVLLTEVKYMPLYLRIFPSQFILLRDWQGKQLSK